MKRELKWIAAAAVVAIISSPHMGGQVSKGKTRPLTTSVLMKSVNGPFCTNLGKLLKEGPADDKGWADVSANAQLLNEAGHILMADGRCPDKAWADASQKLRDGADAVLKAAASKDTAQALDAFNNSILASCKGCHSVHRVKK